MDLYTLFENAFEAVADDTTLRDYAMLHYGRPITVKTDPPPKGLPGQDGCPFVTLHSPGKDASQRRGEILYSFAAVVFIYEPDAVTRAESNINEAKGTQIICTLGEYIKDAVRSAVPSGSYWFDYRFDTDTVNLFPLISAEMAFDITEEVIVGTGDPTA